MSPRLRRFTALSLMVGAAACRGSPAPGVRVEAADAAVSVVISVAAGGESRTVRVHAPRRASGPMPLVLNLHGSGGTAAGQEWVSGMDAAADAHVFLVAYPQGAVPMGGGFAWNVPGQPLVGGARVPSGAADDVDFIDRAIGALARAYPVDLRRIYLTGYSGGARMASYLACALTTHVAAIAPVAGVRFPAPCADPRPVPVIAFHGTSDPINPYQGGDGARWSDGVEKAVRRWAEHDGCAPAAAILRTAPGVRRFDYERCAAGAAVQLYAIDGMGHVWPGGAMLPAAQAQRFGPASRAIDANEVMWAFFETHASPAP